MNIQNSTTCRPLTRAPWKPGLHPSAGKKNFASAADHSVTDIDRFEQAHFDEESMRNAAEAAKKKYEDGLRAKVSVFRVTDDRTRST